MRLVLVVLASLLAACGEGATPDAGMAMDAAAPRDASRPDAQADVEGTGEWVFLLRYAHLPDLPPSSSDEVPGMNLDAHDTRSTSDPIGCFFEDWSAPARYLEVEGIDNQVPGVTSAIRAINEDVDLNADIEQAIRDLDALLVVRVTRIGHPIDDGEVDVAIFQTRLVGEPRYETVTIEGRAVETLAPGQIFEALPESLIEGRPRTQLLNASLRGGRLYTPEGNFSLRIPARDMRVIELELNGMRIGGRADELVFEHGLIAGHVRVEDVRNTIGSLNLDSAPDVETIDRIAEQLADIDVDDDGRCEAISVGLQVEGVAAELVFP